jgi:hypothetical protein
MATQPVKAFGRPEVGDEVMVRCRVVAISNDDDLVRLVTVIGSARYPEGVNLGLMVNQVEPIPAPPIPQAPEPHKPEDLKTPVNIGELKGGPATSSNVSAALHPIHSVTSGHPATAPPASPAAVPVMPTSGAAEAAEAKIASAPVIPVTPEEKK